MDAKLRASVEILEAVRKTRKKVVRWRMDILTAQICLSSTQ